MISRFSSFEELYPNKLGIQRCRELEWIIPNRLGGYSSSTVILLNTSRFHGLLVSGCQSFRRMLYLQRMDEEIIFDDKNVLLSTEEDSSGIISEGFRYMNRFEYNHDRVSFHYRIHGVSVIKRILPSVEYNSLAFFYEIENNSNQRAELRIKPLVNSRENNSILERGESIGNYFEPKIFVDNIASVSSFDGYIAFYSDTGRFLRVPEEECWRKGFYAKENSEEWMCSPLWLSVPIEADTKLGLTLYVVAYPTEEETAEVLRGLLAGQKKTKRIMAGGRGASVFSLLNAADSFIVKAEKKLTILSGFPSLGERGRDAMISLPGLTLIEGKHKEAEKILERFLNSSNRRNIPSGFIDNKPVFEDLDTSLWLIDRIYQYIKYVGVDEGKRFLHTYWWTIKDIVRSYMESSTDGLLVDDKKTWMLDAERKKAVEVQGLWYNALKEVEYFAELMGDETHLFSAEAEKVKESFIEKYWNGKYLNDSEEDDSLRPNQVILLSLDFRLVDDEKAKAIMEAVESELLTPFGLRTLNPKSGNYDPKSRYDGGVWPWLLGSYVKAHIRLYESRLKAKEIIENLLEYHTHDAGIGTISEFFCGEKPYSPMGEISYACSVAELLRCYFEDIIQKKPAHEKALGFRLGRS